MELVAFNKKTRSIEGKNKEYWIGIQCRDRGWVLNWSSMAYMGKEHILYWIPGFRPDYAYNRNSNHILDSSKK
jgi:hypothetical protein